MRTIKNTVSPSELNLVAGYLHTGFATYSSIAKEIGFDARNVSRWFAANKFITKESDTVYLLDKDIVASNIVVGTGTVIIVDPSKASGSLTLTSDESVSVSFDGFQEDLEQIVIVDSDDEVYLPTSNSKLYVAKLVGDTGELEVVVKTPDSLTDFGDVKVNYQQQEDEYESSDTEDEEDEFEDATWQASKKYISVVTSSGEVYNANKEHPNFQEALENLIEGDIRQAVCLINTKKGIESYVKGDIKIEGNQLFYKDIEIISGLATRIIECYTRQEDISTLIAFLENVMSNPTRKTVYRLFDFLRANDIEITEDGYFLAWKIVTKDFKDCYTRKIDNSVGTTVEMERFSVQDDDSITCSHGLHVCSRGYLGHYGSSSDVVVRVKVHPADVVSIPVDYDDAKMRVCKYVVDSIADLTNTY